MHIVLLFFGLLGGGLFWWYRLKVLGSAAGDLLDTVGTFRGYIRRMQLRRKAEESPLTAIESPVCAAATVILAIVADGSSIDERPTAAVRGVLVDIGSVEEVDEALIYADWACRQVGDTSTIIDKTTPLLRQWLSSSEKHELIDMLAPGQRFCSNRFRSLQQ